MSGSKITLTSSILGAGAYVGDDAILTPGSLILHDLTHSQNPLPSGVPISGATIPNIAYAEAIVATGGGTQTGMASSFTNNSLAADAVFERTTKGGLHGLYSQVNNASANRGAYFSWSTAIQNFMFANLQHNFYFSIWTYRTRIAKNTAQPRMVSIYNTASPGYYELNFDSIGNSVATGKGSSATNGFNTTGLSRRSVETANFSSSGPVAANPPANAAAYIGQIMAWGNYGFGYSAWANIAPGDIFYRCYLEDLTFSGRSFTTVDALDSALLTQRALTTGGAYYGDSGWTSPATFP